MKSFEIKALNPHGAAFVLYQSRRDMFEAFLDFVLFTLGVAVGDEIKKPTGIHLLLKECRRRFRIPENTEHYSEKDFREAEKKFIKLCFVGGQPREQNK